MTPYVTPRRAPSHERTLHSPKAATYRTSLAERVKVNRRRAVVSRSTADHVVCNPFQSKHPANSTSHGSTEGPAASRKLLDVNKRAATATSAPNKRRKTKGIVTAKEAAEGQAAWEENHDRSLKDVEMNAWTRATMPDTKKTAHETIRTQRDAFVQQVAECSTLTCLSPARHRREEFDASAVVHVQLDRARTHRKSRC